MIRRYDTIRCGTIRDKVQYHVGSYHILSMHHVISISIAGLLLLFTKKWAQLPSSDGEVCILAQNDFRSELRESNTVTMTPYHRISYIASSLSYYYRGETIR